MNQSYLKSLITYTNCKYFNIDIEMLYLDSGKKISEKLIDFFGKDKEFGIICGLAGNGADGLATAIELTKNRVRMVKVYLVGRQNFIENPIGAKLFNELQQLLSKNKSYNLSIKQDCFAKDIEQPEVLIEALVGTGLEGNKLNKRFSDVIKRISHFNSKLVAIDVPAPSYNPDKTYSLLYPKLEHSEVIEVNVPKEIGLYCGPGDVKYLNLPKTTTHKKNNGKLLFISSTNEKEYLNKLINLDLELNFGLMLYNFNQEKIIESKKAEIINDLETDEAINKSDSIYYGNFDEVSLVNRGLIGEIIKYKGKKQIINSRALNFINVDGLRGIQDCMVLPDKENISKFSNRSSHTGFNQSLRSYAIENNINIVTFGFQSILYSNHGDFKISTSSVSSKNDFKEVFSNLVAAFSTMNSVWSSMKAASFVCEMAYKISKESKEEDYVKFVKDAIEWCLKFN